jgi:hypothetical protein
VEVDDDGCIGGAFGCLPKVEAPEGSRVTCMPDVEGWLVGRGHRPNIDGLNWMKMMKEVTAVEQAVLVAVVLAEPDFVLGCRLCILLEILVWAW